MRSLSSIALSLVALAACVLAVGFSAASFTDTTPNPQTISAIADWTAPSAEASTIAVSESGVPGYAKASSSYFVYAKVVDSGNPPSGIASVKADVHNITSGQSAVSMVAGAYQVGGVSYNYRSPQLTAGSGSGAKTYSLALADSAANSASPGFSATVYGAFKGSGIETANTSGGAEGRPEKGDTISFAFNNIPEAQTIVANWDGSGTKAVTVTIANGASGDLLSVGGATIGSVELKADVTTSSASFSGSTMSLSGSTVTIVLGTVLGSTQQDTGKSKAVWTPVSSIRDLVGNVCSTSSVTDSSSQRQF